MPTSIADEQLDQLRDTVERMVRDTFPHVAFTNIWIVPRYSFHRDLMIDIWSIYDGELKQIHTPENYGLRTRIHDALRGHGIDGSASLQFVMRSEAGDWKPEGI